ncbi:MAG: metal ABC transporter permease, partial [Nanoarchaeota archaeon]|nr:metal ABC transporter permease [Nanoarchaeota archaeon]
MIDILYYGFMQKALLAGILTSIACSILGVFLLLRKSAFISEGLAHISLAGIALGFLLGYSPILVSAIITAAGAIGIILLKEKAKLYGDTAIGILSYTGLAFGILLASFNRSSIDLMSYLFGNILAISGFDLSFSVVIALLTLFFIWRYYKDLFSMTFDEETAKVSGVNVRRVNFLLAMLVAATVVISMRVVGILLSASFMIIPAAASLQLCVGFKKTLLFSVLIGVSSVVLGLIASFAFDLPSGPTIVILNFA